MLGLSAQAARPQQPVRPGQPAPFVPSGNSRFLLPIQQCEYTLSSILEQLQRDPWPVATDKRPQRCTGVAMSVAVGLLETTYQNNGGRVMLFVGGAATEGPGMVVGTDLKEPLRSHHDIEKENVKHYKKASKVLLLFRTSSVCLRCSSVSPLVILINASLFTLWHDSSTKDWPSVPRQMDTLSTFSQDAWIKSDSWR
jgi:hypothetical protein